jgi:predicted phosphodiesterase
VSPFRYGVISDIHANLQALEAVTGALERIGVDRYLCPGDLVGYGAQPNECLEVVAGLEAVCVAGNHDLMAIGELPTDKCIPLGRRAIRWTRDVRSDEARAYLCALPRRAEAEGGIVIAHGALHDPERYILTTDQAGAELDRLAREHPGSRALVVGHTHQAFACDGRRTAGEPATEGELALAGAPAWLLNPGAVGQSRERRAVARFMVLDLDRDRASFPRRRLRRGACEAGAAKPRPARPLGAPAPDALEGCPAAEPPGAKAGQAPDRRSAPRSNGASLRPGRTRAGAYTAGGAGRSSSFDGLEGPKPHGPSGVGGERQTQRAHQRPGGEQRRDRLEQPEERDAVSSAVAAAAARAARGSSARPNAMIVPIAANRPSAFA